MEHIRYLSQTIGGRGSCTPQERQAAEYVAAEMRSLGLQGVQLETYSGAPSTYRPYVLAFGMAVLGTLIVWLFPSRLTYALAALLEFLAAWGMLTETDFSDNWMRLLLPSAPSQNAVGFIPASAEAQKQVILCAHLDTHRTPIFYSSKKWHALFGALVGVAFISMLICGVAYSLGFLFTWSWLRYVGLILAAIQVFALGLCIHADFTPFSPGANDNASGVAVILALAEHLVKEPLMYTQVWLAFTGCEEAAAYGMIAFLDTHADELGEQAVYVILDQVGSGHLEYLTKDGLIIKRATHPQALAIAERAKAACEDIYIKKQVGIAYTDAAVATKRGLMALTLVSVPAWDTDQSTHWHQMDDTLEYIDSQTLKDAYDFTWQILQEVDKDPQGGRDIQIEV